jgi:hypothetical protein
VDSGRVPAGRNACVTRSTICLLSFVLHCQGSLRDKRMAWLGFVEVLAFYDLEVKAEDEEVETLCSRIITDDLGGEDVAEWVIDKLVEIQGLGLQGVD